MSIYKIENERIERFSLTLHPKVDYLSCSDGVSGSAHLRTRPSPSVKELVAAGVYGEKSQHIDASSPARAFNAMDFKMVDDVRRAVLIAREANANGTSANVEKYLESYMKGVNQSPNPSSNSKKLYITRFDPPFTLNDVAIEKRVIKNCLFPFYESKYDLCEMAYTNYHTLNFFSAPNTAGAPQVGETSRLPDNSAIIYQNFSSVSGAPRPYSPSSSFSFDFYCNPRYANEKGSEFKAGTILHLSSTFCLSIVSGTSRDQNNLVDGYRISLQLSHSADISPSTLDYDSLSGVYPKDLIFVSPDNSLSRNKWHHVTVRWGTDTFNKGTGSIDIDGTSTQFVVPSASILPPDHISVGAMFLGNYYESSEDGSKFFNKNTLTEGVSPVIDFGPGSNTDPETYHLRHPLNAEVHELKIFNRYISSEDILKYEKGSPASLESIIFYVPPIFTEFAPSRDMLVTPFQTENRKSKCPFNENFSFGVGGFLMNLENHVQDFSTKSFPRLLNLTASIINSSIVDITANGYIYASGSTKKRNLTILPCDNGRFTPNYALFMTGSEYTKNTRYSGGEDTSIISLENMIPSSKIFEGLPTVSIDDLKAAAAAEAISLPDYTGEGSIVFTLAGVTPESLDGDPGPILTIAQRTRDRSSNEICFFDISNLYYGDRIQDRTLYIVDKDLTGSDGKISVTIRDDGNGGMYRCDADGEHPVWSNIGNCLYEEGLVVVKSPSFSYFGKDKFETRFNGEQNLHISMINIPLEAGMFNSSSNPTYIPLSASDSPSDEGERFIYIDSLNIHDENLNVIMRSNFSQPIKKRIDDSMVIRFKMDF
jgi:hypothetical protein